MTISVRALYAGSSDPNYHTNHLEYYTDTGETEEDSGTKQVVGFWLGDGAVQLGLTQSPIVVGDPRFAALYKAIHPSTGTPLRRGANTVRTYRDRKTGAEKEYKPVAAFDLTFSGEKAYDILAGLGPVEIRQKILHAYECAVAGRVESLTRSVGYVRTGPGGRQREKAGLICAVFPHHVNRNGEPKVHMHMVVFNIGLKENGQGGTLDSKRLLNRGFVFKQGQEFRDSLAYHVSSQLQEYGLHFEPYEMKNGRGYRIKGIPQSLQDAFSTRRKEIEKKLAGKKNPSSREVQVAVLSTRQKKPERINLTELRKRWQNIAQAHGFDVKAFLETSRKRYIDRLVFQSLLERHQISKETERQFYRSYKQVGKDGVAPHESIHVKAAQLIRKQVRQGMPLQKRRQPSPAREPQLSQRQSKDPVTLTQKLKRLLSPSRWLRRRTLDEKIEQAIKKAEKRSQWFQAKFRFLYATGQINRKTYLKYTTEQRVPKTLLGIEWQYWTGRIKLSQRIQLRKKHGHGTPTVGMPRTRLAINVARARGQVSEVQRLLMIRDLKRKEAHKTKPAKPTAPRRTHRFTRKRS